MKIPMKILYIIAAIAMVSKVITTIMSQNWDTLTWVIVAIIWCAASYRDNWEKEYWFEKYYAELSSHSLGKPIWKDMP